VRSTAHAAASGFGLDGAGAFELAQALDEVFGFVATARGGTPFHLTVADRRHCAEAVVRCDLPREELHWLSAVRPIDLEDEDALRALGLLLSSRLVDRFSVGFDAVGAVVLRLSKDRTYASVADHAEPRQAGPVSESGIDVHAPSDAQMLRLAALFRAACAGRVPLPFRGEGRAADMRAAGDIDALVAAQADGSVRGAIAWVRTSPRLVTVFGPVMAAGREDLAAPLVDHLLRLLARSDALVVVAERIAPGFPVEQFEPLGTLAGREIFYRGLEEDPGGFCWADAATRPLLEAMHDRMSLPRDVLDAATVLEPALAHGLLGATIDRAARQVTLRPLIDGRDMPALLASHVDLCRRDGFEHILLETDHGIGWHARLGGAIRAGGFVPRILLPNAAVGDALVWAAEPA
jgi:hypothetical protein